MPLVGICRLHLDADPVFPAYRQQVCVRGHWCGMSSTYSSPRRPTFEGFSSFPTMRCLMADSTVREMETAKSRYDCETAWAERGGCGNVCEFSVLRTVASLSGTEITKPERKGRVRRPSRGVPWPASRKELRRMRHHAVASPKRVFGWPRASVVTVNSLPECGARLENPGGRRR